VTPADWIFAALYGGLVLGLLIGYALGLIVGRTRGLEEAERRLRSERRTT